jgi:hypothetical protein
MGTLSEKANCAAWVILDKRGELVAKVNALYTGRVAVEVWQMGKGTTYTGKAGGYGYDKFTAALSGAEIDGHRLYNHSEGDERTTKILKAYHADKLTQEQAEAKADKIGARFANYGHGPNGKPMSLYYQSGLDRLSKLGYKVIQAI